MCPRLCSQPQCCADGMRYLKRLMPVVDTDCVNDAQLELMESVASGASTSVPSLRQRYWDQVDGLTDINLQNADGWSVVHAAARYPEVLADVLARGGNAGLVTRQGWTPLWLAAQPPVDGSVRLLLAAGADPNASDRKWGNAPLHYAVLYAYDESVEMLLEHGADPRLMNRLGQTPISRAEDCRGDSPVGDVWDARLSLLRDTAMDRFGNIDPQPLSLMDEPTPKPSTEKHTEFLRELWRTRVPRFGQADTVQGELLRCLARLDDEANRNGNINYDRDYGRMRKYVMKTLLDPTVFTPDQLATLRADLANTKKNDYLDQSGWTRLNDAVAEWCLAHPEPLPHTHDPNLMR